MFIAVWLAIEKESDSRSPLQKSFTVDFLTKKRKVNEGEVPQYYVENSHSAIVSGEVFDLVQHELEQRKGKRYTSSTNCLSSRIICGDCGDIYGSKVWHSTSKYRRIIWQCNVKFRNGEKCTTPHFYEDDLKILFVNAFNSLITDQESVFAAYDDSSTVSRRIIIPAIQERVLLTDLGVS